VVVPVALGIVAGFWFGGQGLTPFLVAGGLGMLVAVAELVARYRDDPLSAVLTLSAGLYIAVNSTAAVAALHLIQVFGWNFGATGTARDITQILVAGFGSAALFRTSLFNVTIGDQVVGIGPSAVLNVLLGAADRSVDRRRAAIRTDRAAEIMAHFPFDSGAETLLRYCLAMMQNLTPAEANGVEGTISALKDPKNAGVPEVIKSYILGLSLLSLVGDKVLQRATDHVKQTLPAGPGQPHPGDDGRPSTAAASPTAAGIEERILASLRGAGGPIPLRALRTNLGLGLAWMSLIGDLDRRGLVRIAGDDGRETIEMAGAA